MILRLFPFIRWFKGYSRANLQSDLVGGLTVAMVLIPQSMAYAQLAGLPPYYGLYAAFLPPMVAALFGSSRQLATGPVAVVSLMTNAALAPIATAGSEAYIAYAILLALLVGIFQMSLGFFKLGMVVNLLSHPVINGFTNAAAIIIATSQLSKIFGVNVDNEAHHYQTIIAVVAAAAHYIHLPTLGMAVLAFLIMITLKKLNPRIPNVLVAVVLTTLLSYFTGFNQDLNTNLDSIQSDEVKNSIRQFNETVLARERSEEERVSSSLALDSVKKVIDKHSPEVVRMRSQVDIQNSEIYQLQRHEADIRKKIRGFLLVSEGGGAPYLLKGSSPGPEVKKSPRWRIRLGQRAIDINKIRLTAGGSVVGEIPSQLPAFKMPALSFSMISNLFSVCIVISILGFMEAISIAKAMAAKTGQRLDPNQELIGQGLSNIIGSCFSSYAVSGSFSRSAVNLQAGAETGLSSVFSSMIVGATLLFFTPLLYYLPQAVLAAIIMMAVSGLVNISGFLHALRVQWYDGAISIITFFSTLAFAPHLDKGIRIGVALSLGVFLLKSMRPRLVSLSLKDKVFKNSFIHKLSECRYLDLIRFDAPLFFANASYLEDKIDERLQAKKELRHIIIAANGISDIDASGQETLLLLIERLRSAGVDISFSGVNEYVLAVLRRTHMLEVIRTDHIYPTMENAVSAIQARVHRGGEEQDCPFMKMGDAFFEDRRRGDQENS